MEMDGCLASSVEVFLVSIPLFFGGGLFVSLPCIALSYFDYFRGLLYVFCF